MEFLKRNKGIFLGLILGMIVSYLYWQYVSCLSGACAITSDPVNSTLYGAFMVVYWVAVLKRKTRLRTRKNS